MVLSLEYQVQPNLSPFLVHKHADELSIYLKDESNFQGKADWSYLPRNYAELCEILYFSQKLKTPITISSNRTSLTGAAIPLEGNIISLEKMEDFHPTWKQNSCLVPAFSNYGDFQKKAHEKGWDLPVDPTSAPDCTIGGAVATNCSGSRSFKYGSLRRFVHYLRIILPTGETISLHRGNCFLNSNTKIYSPLRGVIVPPLLTHNFLHSVKNTTGYYNAPKLDLIDSFIGSEGTLGIITEIGLQLLPAPFERMTLLVPVYDERTVLPFWKLLKNNGKGELKDCLSAMDYIDPASCSLIDEFPFPGKIPKGGFFILELESKESEIDLLLLFEDFMSKHEMATEGIMVGDDPTTTGCIYSLRHEIPEKINQLVKQQKKSKIGMDFSVPDASFPALFQRYHQLKSSCSYPVFIFGHIGENNLHVNLLPGNSKEEVQAREIVDTIAQWVLRNGGTLSSEHGIGKTKRHFLKMTYTPEEYKQMKKYKLFWDPSNILNRGNLFYE